MDPDADLLVLAVPLAAAVAASLAFYVWVSGRGTARRMAQAAAHARRAGLVPDAGRSAVQAGGGLLSRLLRGANDTAAEKARAAAEDSPLRLRLKRAGMRGVDADLRFASTRLLLTLVLPLLAAGTYGLAAEHFNELALAMVVFCMAAVAWCAPGFWLDARVARRQRELAAHFPDAIDMIRLCVEAGQGLDAAIKRVEREIRITCVPLYDELRTLNLELQAGVGRARALKNLAQRIGLPEVDGVVSMLVQVERLGTSVADALRIHAEVLRTRRRQCAHEMAAKVPVKLLFPMIFCIFPALMIVLLGPAAISVMRTLSGTMGAG